MSERARLAVFIAASIALFMGVSLLVRATTSFDYSRDHASDRTNPWGTKAWRELLERSGVGTETWAQSLTGLSEEVDFLIILDPGNPVTGQEREALTQWVAGGGRLIIAPFAHRAGTTLGGRTAKAALEQTLAAFGVGIASGSAADVRVRPAADSSLTADVSSVLVPTDGRLRIISTDDEGDGASAVEVLLSDEDGRPAAVSVTHGEGHVIVLSEAEIVSNATLPRADNVVLAANLVFAGGAPERVYFDEYHHGIVGAEGVFAGREVDTTPFRNTALALLGVALIYAIGRSRRFGAPMPQTGGTRRASADYVRALAQIHSRARAAGTAASMLAAGLRRRAAAAAGMPSTARNTALAGALQARRLPGGEIVDLLERLEKADESLTNAELLTLAQQVAHYERML